MADPRVTAIRADPLVGRGTCSTVDECMDDSDLIFELDLEGITDPTVAVGWAREDELMWREQGTNASSGEADCPLVASYRAFKAEMDNA